MKKILSIVLAISMILVTFPVTSFAANAGIAMDNVFLTSTYYDNGSKTVTATMTFVTPLEGVAIMAVYDNSGKLLNVSHEEIPEATIDFSMSLDGNASYVNCIAKIFFVEDFGSLSPINNVVSGTITSASSSEDENINTEYVKIRGIIESTSFVDIESSTPDIDTTEKPEVYIDVKDNYDTENEDFIDYYGTGDGLYFVGDTNAEEYIGRSVIAYVKPSGGASLKFEIDSIELDPLRNETLTMRLDQFEDYKTTTIGSTRTHEIEYYKEGASKSTFVKLEDNIPLVFNYVGGFNASDLDRLVGSNNKFGGEITLVDNDENKGYDVAFCSLAATAVVKKVTANSITLYNSARIGGYTGTKTIYVYPEDETKVVRIYKDGEIIDHTELNEWDILSVYGDCARPDVLIAEVVSTKVEGTVSASKTSKTSAYGIAYKVDDVWYDVAEGVYDEGIDGGVTGTFCIDEFGKIAAFIKTSVGSFGYVIAVKADEAEFGAASACVVKVQMLTADGIEVLELKNNTKFDNLTLKVGDWTFVDNNTNTIKDDITGDDITDGQGNVIETPFEYLVDVAGSVVKYTKDANGKLATVTTAGYTNGATEADFTTSNIAAGTYEFDAEDISLGKAIDPEATIFVVGNTIDEYAVVKASDLVDRTDYCVNASYQTKKADDADMIVITFASFNGVSAASNVAVISGISKTTDKNGYTVFDIDYLQDGEVKSAVTTAEIFDVYAGNLNIGDAVKIKTTGGLITNIAFVFNFADGVRAKALSTGSTVPVTLGTAHQDEVFAGGVVTNYSERSKTVTIGSNMYNLSKGAHFYEINSIANSVSAVVKDGPTFTSIADSIYDYTNVKLLDSNNNVLHESISSTDVQRLYADYVYVRTFEDEVVDVIVVKGYNVKTPEVKLTTIDGIVTQAKASATSADGAAYKIGDAWYDISENPKNDSVYLISVGCGGDFLVDPSGKIVAYYEDPTLTDGLEYEYGYVMAIKAQETSFGAAGACEVKAQILTSDGVEVVTLKNDAKFNMSDGSTVILNINDWYMYDYEVSGDGYKFDELCNIEGAVVKFGKDDAGYVASIIEAGYSAGMADADFTTSNIAAGTYEFDAEDISLGKAIAPDATIYVVGNMLGEYLVVSADDLEHLVDYFVLASYQTKKANDADILVISFASFNGVSAFSNVAVVSGLSTAYFDDGTVAYAIDYLQDGETHYAYTTPEVYDNYIELTVGDVVKVKKMGEVITKISPVFDFAEGVRPNRYIYGSAPALNATGSAGMDETFDGGVVTNYAERSETVTIGSNTYRLDKAVNVYTIDNTGRELEVTAGGAFTSLSEYIYDDYGTNKIVDTKGATIATGLTDTQVQKTYADYVYVRTFEDDLIDVIIVKGYDVIVE